MPVLKSIGICFLFFATLIPTVTRSAIPSNVYLLRYCPGDTTDEDVAELLKKSGTPSLEATGEEFSLASLATAIFSAVLPKVVGKGVSAVGKAMTDAASEKQVDSLHGGGHLYVWSLVSKDTYDFRLNTRCVVVASRSVKSKTGAKLSDALRDFPTTVRTLEAGKIISSITNDGTKLTKLLKQDFPDDTEVPAFVAVFDLQLSAQQDEARLVPRFARLEQGLRGSKRKKSDRTMTLVIELKSPDADKPFATTKAVFRDIKQGTAYTLRELRGSVSDWFNLPEIPKKATDFRQTYVEAGSQLRTHHLSARLSAMAVRKITGDNTVPPEFDGTKTDLDSICQGEPADFRNEWILHKTELSDLQRKTTKKNPLAKEIAIETSYVTYYDSCRNAKIAQKKVANAEGMAQSLQARSYDLQLSLLEYRDRPWLRFFGEVLSDEEVKTGITSAVINAVDPAKRQEREEQEANERLALQQQYEAARVAAELAIVAYNAADDSDKPTKYIDMESKKRAANRLAQQLGVSLPYPDSGLWL